jgi:diguanylate cyclase (GGDEF)-like protein/PAS domain S-box-containing protein
MEHVHGSYDGSLVIYSYIIAVLASYTTLDLAGRVSSGNRSSRKGWLLFGACAMGLGIWSMHFVGMLAFSLPIAVEYDLAIVIISVLAAIAGSYIALYVVSRNQLTVIQLLVGGALLATGVSVMHYVGMAAMLIDITYKPVIFVLSILIAFAASIAALWLTFYFRNSGQRYARWKKLGSGLIMGAAISGMHYTGMAAANFHPSEKKAIFYGVVLEHGWLAYLIIGGTLVTLGLSLFSIYISKQLAGKDLELEQNEKWFRSLYENNQDGIVSLDVQFRVISCNPVALDILGLKSEQVFQQKLESLIHIIVPEQRENVLEMFRRAFSGETVTGETTIERMDGRQVELSLTNAPVLVDDVIVGTYIILKDITAKKQAEAKVKHLAFHDELTGLPNRRLFNQAIEEAIVESKQSKRPFAVMVLDIDRFKMINDSLGHTYGDHFLKEVSSRIAAGAAKYNVMVARMGGDEFTMLYRNYNDDQEVRQFVQGIIERIQVPYRLKDNDFYVSASIGIATFPLHGDNDEQLLKNADTAMYEVKKKGKNGFEFFSSLLDEQLAEKIELEGDLRKAINRGELMLHYQPQIRANDLAMVGVEALVRWKHPEKGMLSPGLFIPIAEETGLIYDIGTWVLREACSQMKRWHDEGGPLIPVSVNLSSQQFHQPQLVEYILAILEETGLPPEFLDLEITESMMMDAEVSASILRELNEHGIKISLDDFGTGYSSLSYLKMFPIHKLKIDRSFIRDITQNQNDKAIVATIISMAQNLNMEVIAEGIETKDQLDILTDRDCGNIQGYYFSKPLSADDVEQAFFVPGRGMALKQG